MKLYRLLIVLFGFIAPILASANHMATGMAAYISGDFQRAINEWKPLAEDGNPVAQYHMGVIYRDGRGVDIDLAEAIRWWKLAATNDHAKAQYELGMAYREGLGVAQRYRRSLDWLGKAALKGYANAQNEVGNAFYRGLGVPQSNMTANYWWNTAARLGHKAARSKLSQLANGEQIVVEADDSRRKLVNGSDWLYRQNADDYTLQLISDSSNDRIRRFIESSGLRGDMAMFAVTRGEKTFLSLVYGVYPDLNTARKAVRQMTDAQRAGAPLIRRIRDVEGPLETAANQTSHEHTRRAATPALAQLYLKK